MAIRIYWSAGSADLERGWAWESDDVTVHGYRTRRAALRGYYGERGAEAFEAGIRYGRKLERAAKRAAA